MSRRQQRRQQLPSDSEEDEEVLDKKSGKSKDLESAPAAKSVFPKAVSQQANDFTCWHCDRSLHGSRLVNKDGHHYCVNCYNEQFANHCDSCQDIISVDNKDLAFKDRHWHDKCFKCFECKNSLVSESFGTRDEKLYCSDCWDHNFAPKCTRCMNPFKAGTMKLSWNGSEWHRDCFLCSNCDKVSFR